MSLLVSLTLWQKGQQRSAKEMESRSFLFHFLSSMKFRFLPSWCAPNPSVPCCPSLCPQGGHTAWPWVGGLLGTHDSGTIQVRTHVCSPISAPHTVRIRRHIRHSFLFVLRRAWDSYVKARFPHLKEPAGPKGSPTGLAATHCTAWRQARGGVTAAVYISGSLPAWGSNDPQTPSDSGGKMTKVISTCSIARRGPDTQSIFNNN